MTNNKEGQEMKLYEYLDQDLICDSHAPAHIIAEAAPLKTLEVWDIMTQCGLSLDKMCTVCREN